MSEHDEIRAEFLDQEGRFDTQRALVYLIQNLRRLDAKITTHGGIETRLEDHQKRLAALEGWRIKVEQSDTVSIRQQGRAVVDKAMDKITTAAVIAIIAWLALGRGGCANPVDVPASVPAQTVPHDAN